MSTPSENMIRREVFLNVSHCVSTLACENGCSGASDTLRGMIQQATELAMSIDDYEQAARGAGWTQTPDGEWWRDPREDEVDEADMQMFLGSGPYRWKSSAEEACECDALEPYQREVCEHWAVSEALARALEALGEKVDHDFCGWHVWARTITGQGIAEDSVIKEIAKA